MDAVGVDEVADEPSHSHAAMLDLSVTKPPNRLLVAVVPELSLRNCSSPRVGQAALSVGRAGCHRVDGAPEVSFKKVGSGVERVETQVLAVREASCGKTKWGW